MATEFDPDTGTRKLSGWLLLGAAAVWLWQQQQPRQTPLKPPPSPADAFSSAINPRYQVLPNVTRSPNGALPASTEDAFPKLPYSTLLQGTPGPGPGRGSTQIQARHREPTLTPWGQQPAYSQPIGPAFQDKPRRP